MRREYVSVCRLGQIGKWPMPVAATIAWNAVRHDPTPIAVFAVPRATLGLPTPWFSDSETPRRLPQAGLPAAKLSIGKAYTA